ncbi:LysM domain-containing protein [Mycena indigotica]|uniref:LysM domain-containing protein n=1 Tax=Mycena indigotica TaxID=2126181 RepID=A0A8H6WEZ1_9AGAR|nr:LysM domain-containing protein [Mycena indigotica]KAF7312348.1 LysM domain-containing protein [Mycena indigotica]
MRCAEAASAGVDIAGNDDDAYVTDVTLVPIILQMPPSSLCLACSSSILKLDESFKTPCCGRVICSSCTSGNPRLTRYNPCLACLGGIAVVAHQAKLQNVDGGVLDEETFVVGDDEEDDTGGVEHSNTQPSSIEHLDSLPVGPGDKYFVKRNDTLRGIALRFRVDGRLLCQLNNLPPSTLSTTPHLLHTRAFLTLPPSAHSQMQASDTRPNSDEERAREVRRTRERAEKRLQTLTKEVDWRVAKMYVALADDPASTDAFRLKQKELSAAASSAITLEDMAVDQYLEDLEWEADQLRAGLSPKISRCPIKQQ